MSANEKQSPNALLMEAVSSLDADKMTQAIAGGADVNFIQDPNAPGLLEEMCVESHFWFYGGEAEIPRKEKFKESEDRLFKCVNILLEHGFDLSRVHRDVSTNVSVFCYATKWCPSLKVVEYLLQKGMNPNILTYEQYSALDNLEGEIWSEEACDRPRDAKYIYQNARLAIAYGARPGWLLDDIRPNKEQEIHASAMSLDVPGIEKLDKETILEFHLDRACVADSKYAFPKEFYFETPKIEKRIISALRVILKKIGSVKLLDESLLHECVELQYPAVLEFLLNAGVDPNLNCFNESYSFVASSALYKFLKHRDYYIPERAEQMEKLLLGAGAVRLRA